MQFVHEDKMVLILGKNVWTDNAGARGCKKQRHLRTKGKDGIHSRNGNIWSLYDSLFIMKVTKVLTNYIGKTMASIICYVKNMKFWKILV